MEKDSGMSVEEKRKNVFNVTLEFKEAVAISKVFGAIFNPVDFLYNLFGKKPKQLKKLQLMIDDFNKFSETVQAAYEKLKRNKGQKTN